MKAISLNHPDYDPITITLDSIESVSWNKDRMGRKSVYISYKGGDRVFQYSHDDAEAHYQKIANLLETVQIL